MWFITSQPTRVLRTSSSNGGCNVHAVVIHACSAQHGYSYYLRHTRRAARRARRFAREIAYVFSSVSERLCAQRCYEDVRTMFQCALRVECGDWRAKLRAFFAPAPVHENVLCVQCGDACAKFRALFRANRSARVGGGRKLHRYGGRKLHTQASWALRERSGSSPCMRGSIECCYVTIWSRG